MGFEKGHRKHGGRKKGTENVITREMREILKEVVSNELNNLPELLIQLKPKERIDVFLKLIHFVLPRIESVKMDIHEPNDLDFLFGKFSNHKS